MKQDRHPIDFDTAGSGEMAVLALVLGLEGPLLTTIMLKQGASLVMALGVLLLPVGIILPLVWVLWRPWPSRVGRTRPAHRTRAGMLHAPCPLTPGGAGASSSLVRADCATLAHRL